MKIAVTGGAGFLGGNLVRALLERGDTVRVLVREDRRGVDSLSVEEIAGDVRNLEDLQACFEGVDAVFHCAAVVSIQGSLGGLVEAINIGGVENVVQACLDQQVKKLVHFSSVHALDPRPQDEPITEERALCDSADRHHPAYARSKANGERAVLDGVSRGLDACILHPSGMIGPWDFKPSPLGEALVQMHRRSLPGLVNGGYNWVDVRDVVASAIQALETGVAGERYLVTGHSTSVRELAEAAQEVTGKKPPWMTSPLWLARFSAPLMEGWAKMWGKPPIYTRESIQVLGDNDDFVCQKAMRELGHSPRPLVESLRDTYEWFEAEGMLD
ncbi:MAG: NAD-dependent epimerase/dehydratase family protein [Myxococcota bacterium]|nr:NAD-dependent epimerase/dehydratase family protein [Myxococcota bacterium]